MKQYRRRYVYFELVVQGKPVTDQQLVNAIRKSLMKLYGEVAVADSRIFLQRYDEVSGTGVLQVNERVLERALAASALVYEIDSSRVSFVPKKTSGTIRALTRKTVTS